jgi:hypothetical protein
VVRQQGGRAELDRFAALGHRVSVAYELLRERRLQLGRGPGRLPAPVPRPLERCDLVGCVDAGHLRRAERRGLREHDKLPRDRRVGGSAPLEGGVDPYLGKPTTLALRWDGRTWTRVATPNPS